MSVEDLKKIIKDVVMDESFDIEKISEDDVIIRYWDSLVQIELINVLEQEYGIKFSMKQIVEMKSIRDIVDTVNEHIKNK